MSITGETQENVKKANKTRLARSAGQNSESGFDVEPNTAGVATGLVLLFYVLDMVLG